MILLAHLLIFLLDAGQASLKPPIAEKLVLNPCPSQLSCRDCLSIPECTWCSKKQYEKVGPRCDSYDNHLSRHCPKENIMNPTTDWEILANEELSNAGAIKGSAIQLKPQELHLSLRPKEAATFTVTFRQAEDYPLDLYYLMDLTWSMKEHKDQLAQLADDIGVQMLNITKNFRLGFGSFIDKVVMPFADMTPERLANPCRDAICSAPYGFRNHLPLTENVSLFMQEVANANLSGNLDNAEGGFDAIMQAITCEKHIKWDNQSRKILLFATDSIFHYAGDGKLGGIVQPNDEQCHLDENGYYTESIHQDYPSLSQITRQLSAHRVNVLFAVPAASVPVYQELSAHIEGSHIGILTQDSSNIVHIIRDQYNKIRSEVILKNETLNPHIKVSYFSRCLDENLKEEIETNKCGGITVGSTVNFTVQVELEGCPGNPEDWKQVLKISPLGLQETVTIHLNLHCQCECENYQEENSSQCSNNGTLSCGICTCNPGYHGRHCECLGDDVSRKELQALCKKDNDSETLCFGRGDCLCGKCECHSADIFGDWCECDTFSCERGTETGEVCGGHGRCCEGICLCHKGWTGTACECSTDQSTCRPPEDPTAPLCSGRGDCVCGTCRCQRDHHGYFGGKYCEDCSTCEGKCDSLRPCVEYFGFEMGPYSSSDFISNCSHATFQKMAYLEENSPYEKLCIYKDEEDCSFAFTYSYDRQNNLEVKIEEEKECSEPPNTLLIIFGVTGGVVLIGLIILLLVRLAMYLQDRRDYQRFLKDLSNTHWGEEINPIYKNATSNYNNPLYDAAEPQNTHHAG